MQVRVGAAYSEVAETMSEVLDDAVECTERKIEMTDTRTVAEIEAELKAAKDALEQRKQEQEAELRFARRREQLALTDGYMQQLQAAMVALGVECSVSPGKLGDYGNTYFATLDYPKDSDGFRASAQPRIERRSGGYGSSDSYQIQFGGYGERKTYARLKDGTFKYDKIASELISYIEHKAAQRALEEERATAYKASRILEDRLEEEFPDCTANVNATTKSDAVQIRFDMVVSIEQARELLTVIQKVRQEARK